MVGSEDKRSGVEHPKAFCIEIFMKLSRIVALSICLWKVTRLHSTEVGVTE